MEEKMIKMSDHLNSHRKLRPPILRLTAYLAACLILMLSVCACSAPGGGGLSGAGLGEDETTGRGTEISGKGTETTGRSSGPAAADIETWRLDDFVMSTVLSATVYGSEDVTGEIKNRLDALEHEDLSWRDPASTVAKVNELASRKEGCEVDPLFAGWVTKSLDLAEKSQGAFDPSLGRLTRLWDIEGDHPQVPEPQALAEIMKTVGYEEIEIKAKSTESNPDSDTGEETLEKAESDVGEETAKESKSVAGSKKNQTYVIHMTGDRSLDLGAVGKGIACDLVRDYLEESCTETVTGAVVSVGGSILTLSSKPDGSPWKVAVQDPRGQDGDYMGVLSLDQTLVVSTSGDYEKYFEEKGTRYHHILDPHTGYPADSGLISVTVVCQDGLLSDGLSTACFVLGRDKGLELLKHYGAEGIFIDKDKKVTVSDGIRDVFTILKDDYTLMEK